MITVQQSGWASQHDWFRRAERGTKMFSFIVFVYDSVLDDVVSFDDYQALRAWAGY